LKSVVFHLETQIIGFLKKDDFLTPGIMIEYSLSLPPLRPHLEHRIGKTQE
jgi:hypothetical protein